MTSSKFWLSLIYLLFSTPIVSSTSNVSGPVVDLGYAQYQGMLDPETKITSFLGMRYASPPVGGLRWQAPQAPPAVSDIQHATVNPNMCYQTNFGNSTTNPFPVNGHHNLKRDAVSTTPIASEDCLFLNVHVPGDLPSEPPASSSNGLPVVVWIHGGGYEYGYAAQYDGADLVTESHNAVVAVVIQYRLGVFGFLSSNEVKGSGALNAGLLDQAYALQWVQKNIAAFGGDPAKVTIWGESAGAGSVLQHIVAHQGNTQPPLFRGAITSSTYLPPQYYYNDSIPQTMYSDVVSYSGCSSSNDTLACLRSVDVDVLQTINFNLAESGFYGTFIFVPVVDGTFIVERPTVTLSKGLANGDMLLSVGNSHEGNTFVNTNETLTVINYISQLFPDMTSSQMQEAASLYNDSGSALDQAIDIMGDSIFVCPTYYLLETFAGRSSKGIFAIPPAYHGQDVSYYFNMVTAEGTPAPPSYNNTVFKTAFSESFLSFVVSLDVNVKFDPSNITPYWAEYAVDGTEMLFNKTETDEPVVKPVKTDPKLLERCAYWHSVAEMTAQ